MKVTKTITQNKYKYHLHSKQGMHIINCVLSIAEAPVTDERESNFEPESDESTGRYYMYIETKITKLEKDTLCHISRPLCRGQTGGKREREKCRKREREREKCKRERCRKREREKCRKRESKKEKWGTYFCSQFHPMAVCSSCY